MGSKSVLTDVCTCFFSIQRKADIETHMMRFMDTAKWLIATYKDLNLLETSPDQLVEMLEGYRTRVISYLETLDNIQQGRAVPEVAIVYDEILMLYSLLFCVYEQFYEAILQKPFREFVIWKGVLSEEYGIELSVPIGREQVSLSLGNILRGNMIFSSYDFPLAFRMLVVTSSELKSICGASLQVGNEELEREVRKFADGLIYLTGIRNQIAHMSNVLECYSKEERKLRRNFNGLLLSFPKIQSDMYKLFDIFNSMSKTLVKEGMLQKKKPRGREKVLEEILSRLPEDERCEKCRALITRARDKARNASLSAKELFE